MHQILYHVGFFTLRSYGLVIILAIFLGAQVAVTMAHFTAKQFEKHIVPLVYSVLFAAIAGARFWQVFFFEPGFYFTHPAEIIAIWHGGLSIQGGIIGGILAGIWYCRRHRLPFWELADLLAPAIILGQGIGRIACLLNGDAFGTPTSSGFGLVYPPGTDAYATFGSQPLWPAEVWEGQLDFIISRSGTRPDRKSLQQSPF